MTKNRPAFSRPGRGSCAVPTAARILVCDDQRLVRFCVRDMLKAVASIQVVGEATGGRPAVTMALELKPDVVLMDVSMPDLDGIEATRQILAKSPEIRVLAYSVDSTEETVKKMFAAGARGYLLKTSDRIELVTALLKVLAGESFVRGQATDIPPQSRRD